MFLNFQLDIKRCRVESCRAKIFIGWAQPHTRQLQLAHTDRDALHTLSRTADTCCF